LDAELSLGALERAKFVYILNRDQASKLTISSPLDAHRNHTICMDVVSMDVGFENPLFASIEVDFHESDTDHTGVAYSKIEKVW
jgi:splicing factor 3B subunit 3